MNNSSKQLQNICVISHHCQGGGKPIDSLWFSKNECLKHNINLSFFWTRRPFQLLKFGLFSERKKVIFDGIFSIIAFHGSKFYELSKLLNKKRAIYWHETDFHAEKLRDNRVFQDAIKDPKLLHFHVCNYGIQMLHEKYGVPLENLYLLNNISDSSNLLKYSLPIESKPYHFVACGIATKRKGIDLFVEIADQTITKNPQAKFIWIGGFTHDFSEQDMATEINRRGLEGKVEFTGYISNPSKIISQARAFILTSRDDPMPKVLMEALALGKECIAFGVGGVPELLGESGLIIPPGDVETFVNTLLQITVHDEASKQFSRRARYLEKFSPQSFGIRFKEAVDWWESAL